MTTLSRISRFVSKSLAVCAIVFSLTGCQTLKQFGCKSTRDIQARQLEMGGQEALSRGRLEQAQDMLSRAVEYAPGDRRIREQLAEVHVMNGTTDQAIAELHKAIELSQNDPPLLVRLGQVYLANGHLLPAERQIELALDGDRNLPSAWSLKGDALRMRGEFTEALTAYQRSLSLDTLQPSVQIKMAELHQQMKQPNRALSCIEQLLSHYPQDQQPEPALLLEGRILMELDQYSPAIEKLARLTDRQGASEEAFVELCRAQLLAGQPSQARLTLAKATEKFADPSKLTALLDDLKSDEQRRLALNDYEY